LIPPTGGNCNARRAKHFREFHRALRGLDLSSAASSPRRLRVFLLGHGYVSFSFRPLKFQLRCLTVLEDLKLPKRDKSLRPTRSTGRFIERLGQLCEAVAARAAENVVLCNFNDCRTITRAQVRESYRGLHWGEARKTIRLPLRLFFSTSFTLAARARNARCNPDR